MAAIIQARDWNVATLNEFRSFFNLTTLNTFEEINPDPVVANNLRTLYKTPNDVELYPGLFAEATRPRMDPAVGICKNNFYNDSVCTLTKTTHGRCTLYCLWGNIGGCCELDPGRSIYDAGNFSPISKEAGFAFSFADSIMRWSRTTQPTSSPHGVSKRLP